MVSLYLIYLKLHHRKLRLILYLKYFASNFQSGFRIWCALEEHHVRGFLIDSHIFHCVYIVQYQLPSAEESASTAFSFDQQFRQMNAKSNLLDHHLGMIVYLFIDRGLLEVLYISEISWKSHSFFHKSGSGGCD